MADEKARPISWWGRFVALFVGVPPVAVHAAETEEDDEPGPFARRASR